MLGVSSRTYGGGHTSGNIVTEDVRRVWAVSESGVSAASADHWSVLEYLPLVVSDDRYVVPYRSTVYVDESGADFVCAAAGGESVGGGSVVLSA